MSTTVPLSATAKKGACERIGVCPYGYFTAGGTEYIVTNPRTPRPWTNLIANPRVGLSIAQSGSGFSWIDNSQLAVITRWQQEFAQDSSGKFLYLRDADSGQLWSLAPAPTWPKYDHYACTHGLGYTTFHTRFDDIEARWTLFVDAQAAVEGWLVELINHAPHVRHLELSAYLEWNCGVQPSPRREFHKIFLETAFDAKRRAIFGTSHMWDVGSERYGHWNTTFPYHSALACSLPLLSAQGDKGAFLGRNGDPRNPAALEEDTWRPAFGRHDDAIAALRSAIELKPGQSLRCCYALATGASRVAAEKLVDQYNRVDELDKSLTAVKAGWRERLAAHRVETPDESLGAIVNDWVRYQAISARIWGRAGYYQQSGAYGFRDQLQDSQVWLTIDPAQCRAQLKMHAAHQFADGSVYHWWHPLSEQGHITKMTDDLLWLAFVSANYIRETNDLSILTDESPFLNDAQQYPLVEHVQRAFLRAFQRTSPRGLPYIGAGDWNDGLSACGLQETGESVWLAQFLVGLLADWAQIYRRAAKAGIKTGPSGADHLPDAQECERRAADFTQRREKLIATINELAWDGGWYSRGTLDDGSVFGSSSNRYGRIFLNAQTWAILNDIAPRDRAAACLAAVKEHLVSPAGALLLAPAFGTAMPEIGYITRYAPGLRENGGVYSHAATWAIAAAAKMRDHELVGRLVSAMNPANKDPERYWAEPYVLPGNVDGPDSPHHGRAGWTWYTGSAQWLHRVVSEWVLGVRPEWDGLRIDPVLPTGWAGARMTRPWRGATYEIEIERVSGLTQVEIQLDGKSHAGNLLPPPAKPGARHHVRVRCA